MFFTCIFAVLSFSFSFFFFLNFDPVLTQPESSAVFLGKWELNGDYVCIRAVT